MKELDVYRALLARAENYAITNVQHVQGRFYSLEMDGQQYIAVVLVHSFDYYQLRYHISLNKPTLIVCYEHDTVVPMPVLSTRAGNLAKAYELPEGITDLEVQRTSRTGARVLLGMYISGVRVAQVMVNGLAETTRKRYLAKAEALGRRKPGRPVGKL